MASVIYGPLLLAWANGDLDFGADPFKVMLTTSAYTENKDTHNFRDDITNEVTGTGYTAGGNTVTVSVNLNTTDDRLEITFGGTTWSTSTITARKAVYYKARGGASSADELCICNDFGSDVTSTGATFTLNSSVMRVTY